MYLNQIYFRFKFIEIAYNDASRVSINTLIHLRIALPHLLRYCLLRRNIQITGTRRDALNALEIRSRTTCQHALIFLTFLLNF